MGPKLIFSLISFTDLKTACLLVLIAILLPIVTVIALTQAGINLVSDSLAKFDPQTSQVQLNNPNGKVVKNWTGTVTWPVKGIVTLEFGQFDPPYQPFHTGIDIANPFGREGDSVVAFSDGKVVFIDESNWGSGKYVMVNHGDNITSFYCHLSEIDVQKGEDVKVGQIIGREGKSGWATGPHLHFQINVYGIPVNPRAFLGNNGPGI